MEKDSCSAAETSETPKKVSALAKCGYYSYFFILGVINNLGYVLILTGSDSLAKNLGNSNFIALYPFSLIICSSLARVLNSTMFITVSYFKRVMIIWIYFFFGYISLYLILNAVDIDPNFDKSTAFYLTMIPSFIMGTGSAFGEATMLGYLRLFPKDYVAGWSSGTGLAGVSGALITLLFKVFQFTPKTLYLIISPVCLLYFISFILVERMRKTHLVDIDAGLIQADSQIKSDVNQSDVSENKSMTCVNFCIAFSKGKRYILNLALVYYLEYTVLSGFCERVTKMKYIQEEAFNNILYELFSLCYQIGVLLSRSSLIVVKKIQFLELFTIIQTINFFLWIIEVYFGFISTSYVLFAHLIIVGLCGGAAYVASFYFILNSQVIESNFKELCVNIGTIFNDIGILMASLTVLLFDNTIMKV